jgi:hypothetical protein
MARVQEKHNTNDSNLASSESVYVQVPPVRYGTIIEMDNSELLWLLRQLLGPNTIETKKERSGRELNISNGIDFKLGALLQGHPAMKSDCPRTLNEGLDIASD